MESVREREKVRQKEKGESSCDSSLPFPASPAMTIEARHIFMSAFDGRTGKGQSFIPHCAEQIKCEEVEVSFWMSSSPGKGYRLPQARLSVGRSNQVYPDL